MLHVLPSLRIRVAVNLHESWDESEDCGRASLKRWSSHAPPSSPRAACLRWSRAVRSSATLDAHQQRALASAVVRACLGSMQLDSMQTIW